MVSTVSRQRRQGTHLSSQYGLDDFVKDGERLPLPIKDLGSCEVYPQTLQHSPNGRFVVVCGDGEYIIYTALAWRNKSFGSGLGFVWADDSNVYAVHESSSRVKIFKNFKERPGLLPKLNYSAEGVYGGALLGVKGNGFLNFYDWESGAVARRIDVDAKEVRKGWAICTSPGKLSYFLLGLLVGCW